MEKRTKESRKRINSLILLIAFTAVMLIVSTYAWFTSQRDITLSNLRGTVEVAENMEISLDAKTWHQEIDLSDAETAFSTAQSNRDSALGETDPANRTTAPAILPAELLPVSGIGETGGTTMPLFNGTATGDSLGSIKLCAETMIDADNGNAVVAKDNGYFAFDMYIKNTSKDGEEDQLQLNLNSAVQVIVGDGALLPGQFANQISKQEVVNGTTVNKVYKGNAASGLQNTVRVALALYDNEVSSTSTQEQILTATKGATIADIAIWEPNSKDHVESIVNNNNKLIKDGSSYVTFTQNSNAIEGYAIESGHVGEDIENVYDMDSEQLARQVTFATDVRAKAQIDGEENYNITDYRIAPDTTTQPGKELPLNITNVSGSAFKITSNTVSRFRVYIWLEGQDVDCINLASQGGGIEVDLGLTKDNDVGEVMNVATN